jgi:hypothetical protein
MIFHYQASRQKAAGRAIPGGESTTRKLRRANQNIKEFFNRDDGAVSHATFAP